MDDAVRVVEAPDRFLREMRLARGRAETTTKAYAEGLSLLLRWCDRTGRDWRTAARDMGLFMFWLRWTPGNGGQRRTVVPGPGARPVRGDGRINKVLTAVRMFLVHAVVNKEAPAWVLEQVYELGDDRDLPVEAKGESGGLRYRLRARHRLQEPESEVDRASDEEVVAMFRACRSARDRLTMLLLARVGLRPGQVAGLHRSDLHLMADSRSLGCDIEGAHIHVVRRQNENNAWSKSKKSWAMPVDFLLVRAFDLYAVERHALLEAGGSDFLLVNLFRPPMGAPVTAEAIGELCEPLSARARVRRRVTPRMCRHAMASNVVDSGGTLDELQALLGQMVLSPEGAIGGLSRVAMARLLINGAELPGPPPAPGPFQRLRQKIGPIHTARRVFKPSRSGIVDDALVARIQKIRILVGLGAVVWVSMSYKLANSVGDVVNDRGDQAWLSVLMLSVTFPVAVGVLLALADPPARRELLRRAAKSFGAMVSIVAAVGVFPVIVLTGFMEGKFATNPVMAVVTYTVLVLTFVWVVPFIFWGIGLALVHVFRTADIHETVPPLLAMALVWEMTVVDLFTGAYAGVPGPLRVLLMLGAPVSVTAVGLWELHRLRAHYGIGVRDMLMRQPG